MHSVDSVSSCSMDIWARDYLADVFDIAKLYGRQGRVRINTDGRPKSSSAWVLLSVSVHLVWRYAASQTHMGRNAI